MTPVKAKNTQDEDSDLVSSVVKHLFPHVHISAYLRLNIILPKFDSIWPFKVIFLFNKYLLA